MIKICVGDVVQIAAEYRDQNDGLYWVREANGDRLLIEPLGTGLIIPPCTTVKAEMVEWPSPDFVDKLLKNWR